ncbi:hypothetical protein CLV97_1335 [Planifilum fimeticola]|uniref:Uncharacterized protein n=1 Tax=Planifilum fimeticola TaxID=201975 RepID=A0A2T0LB84_9BACL|nr:hypothetical protein CLV97_1335 [Planifilum fimeticola]
MRATDWKKEVSRLLLDLIERWEPKQKGDEERKVQAIQQIEAWALEVRELSLRPRCLSIAIVAFFSSRPPMLEADRSKRGNRSNNLSHRVKGRNEAVRTSDEDQKKVGRANT